MIRKSKRSENLKQAMSIKFNTMVYEKTARGEDVIVLSLGEAFFDIPLLPFDSLAHPEIYHYSHSRGLPGLREQLSAYFKTEYNVLFKPENEILVTAGSKAAIQMALLSIADAGDEVIYQEPAWVSYSEEIKICDAIPVAIPRGKSIDDFENYITDKTRCIIINNPNNPSGYLYSKEDLEKLYAIAKKHRLYILSDEAYSDFILEYEKFISLGCIDPTFEHSIICNSISKNYGISGWRMGYVISNEEMIDEILKYQQHIITCAPTILQMYIEEYFERIIKITKPQILEVVEKRKKVGEYLNEIGLIPMEGSASFYFFVSIKPSKLSSVDFCVELLEKLNVSAVPGLGYGKSCDDYIRLSVGTETWERTTAGLDAIKSLIESSK